MIADFDSGLTDSGDVDTPHHAEPFVLYTAVPPDTVPVGTGPHITNVGKVIYRIFLSMLLYGFLGIHPVEAFVAFAAISSPPIFHTALRSAHQAFRGSTPLDFNGDITGSNSHTPFLTVSHLPLDHIEIVEVHDEVGRRQQRSHPRTDQLSALVDNGSQVTTCHERTCVHNLRPFDSQKFLHAADKKVQHRVTGTC